MPPAAGPRIGDNIGRPVVLCSVATDAEVAVADLNRRHYGEATLWPGSFQPLEPQRGWDDWSIYHLEAVPDEMESKSYGVSVEDGLIRFPLPELTHVAEVRETVAGALTHLRFHDVVRHPAWLERRSDEDPLAGILIHPRYHLPDRRSFRGAKIVNDIYALDPTDRLINLLWQIVAACS